MTERKLAAILSADVVGYSRLMAEDEAATIQTLKASRDLMGGLIRQHGGRVVDAVGDNLLADFPSVVDAVACGTLIQNELASANAERPEPRRMLLRIGINLGDVVVEEDRIYGNGVNIAARVEALAEPGGVAISGAAFDQVDEKLGLEFEDLGQHEVKNIPKPIRVYRVRVREDREEHAARTVPGFSGRPAIAVLPFDNLSGDPEQEYFADGVAEDLITRLASWRSFPVIARNSSFVYRGRAVDVKQVSHELGVRYVVEGSVRKAGSRVRITAQLIDATTGEHVWADHYDRELQDIFELQDEISETIAGRVGSEVLSSERDRSSRIEPRAMQAWDLAQRGFWHLWKFTIEENAQARSFFQRSVELDDRSALTFVGLSLTYAYDRLFAWVERGSQSAVEGLAAAERAVACDEQHAYALARLGGEYLMRSQGEKAVTVLERAVELNPSNSTGCALLGGAYGLSGREDEGIDLVKRALRLSPYEPENFIFISILAQLNYGKKRYEEAVANAIGSLERQPGSLLAYPVLVAGYARLGRLDEAQSALRRLREVHPTLSLARAKNLIAFMDPTIVQNLTDSLRSAGFKEGAPEPPEV